MSIQKRIREFWEKAVGQPKTVDDFVTLASTLREKDLPAARAALEAIEDEFDRDYFSIAADEVSLKRMEKRRAEAREKVARIEEALRRAEAQAEQLELKAKRDAELAQARQIDEALTQRDQHLAELDKAVETLARSYRSVLEDNARILPMAQQHLQHVPDMFYPHHLQALIEQRLFGLTDGKWRGFAGLETPFTARQLPSLAARGKREHELVMLHQPQPDPEPPVAA